MAIASAPEAIPSFAPVMFADFIAPKPVPSTRPFGGEPQAQDPSVLLDSGTRSTAGVPLAGNFTPVASTEKYSVDPSLLEKFIKSVPIGVAASRMLIALRTLSRYISGSTLLL